MPATWKSLYLSCDNTEQIIDTLQSTLDHHGYTRYDPFEALPGRAYPETVKLFVAPSQQGWTRLIGDGFSVDADEFLAPSLSQLAICLAIALEGETGSIQAYEAGEQVEMVTAMQPHLRPGASIADFQRAAAGEFAVNVDNTNMPLEVLPDDVQAMAKDLNTRQVNKLFNKWMKKVSNHVAADRNEAEAILQGVNWSSAAGQRIQAMMACLNIPGWQQPDFVTLRDAYQLQRRRQRNPNAVLYPGDAEAMNAVTDALNYHPVYGGKTP
jgi:hypothetical protein